MPGPSLGTTPSARASNARQRPSADSMPIRQKPTYQSGRRRELTPPASASGQPSRQMLSQARWTATSADEHAVSTATLGPRKSKQYEMRLAAMLREPPVFE